MKKHLLYAFKAFLAGVMISIGGFVYLSVGGLAGAIMFAVGLYVICVFGLNLYTGKVGIYLPANRSLISIFLLFEMWLMNLVGCFWSASVLHNFAKPEMLQTVQDMVITKMNMPWLQLFVLGIFCGILMYSAVMGFAKTGNPLIVIFCVATFIMCKFEHCIADAFYCFLAREYAWKVLIAVTLGNTFGAVIIPILGETNDEKKSTIL